MADQKITQEHPDNYDEPPTTAKNMASTREWQLYKELLIAMANRGLLDPTKERGSEANVTQICQHVAGLTQIALKVSKEKRY